jgi:DNA-binding response OmpR family regulator
MNTRPPESSGICILIVEDEELVAMSTRIGLEDVGITCVCVTDTTQALSAFSASSFTAAIIDVGLPGLSGDELARRLRKTSPTLPILLCTGFEAATYATAFQDDLYIRVIEKPFTEPQLLQQLDTLGVTLNTR